MSKSGTKWTPEEIEFMEDNYEEHGMHYCANHIGRTTSAIQHKAERLGLRRKGEGRKPRIVVIGDGYLAVSDVNDRQRIHRMVIEQHIGRKLEPHEIVHHKNGDKQDNRIENLEIMTRSEHMRHHYYEREVDEKGRFTSR